MSDIEPLLIISSDGHVSPPMPGYTPYLDEEFREEFEAFLVDAAEHGCRTGDRRSLEPRLDLESIEEWEAKLLDTGRWDLFHDPHVRLTEVEKEGVAAEVLFPDFGGMPFQLSGITGTMVNGNAGAIDFKRERAGMRAYNRYLVDFVGVAPERFAGMAAISWQHDVDDALAEIRWACDAGLKGIVLPKFAPDKPLFHPQFEPIWNTLEELGMVVNSHGGASATSNVSPTTAPGVPHPALAVRVCLPEHMFHTHNILSHLIWGGVLERHPALNFVFTEQGSGWVISELEGMDYTYEGSFFRSDYHEVIRSKPSEYFHRQVYLGASGFSRGEIAARHQIGIDNIMIGMDIPHHEGTLIETTQEYLRATLGAENVPVEEARALLGKNAARVFGFDIAKLLPVAADIALLPENVLTPPDRNLFPRGDVHRPAGTYR